MLNSVIFITAISSVSAHSWLTDAKGPTGEDVPIIRKMNDKACLYKIASQSYSTPCCAPKGSTPPSRTFKRGDPLTLLWPRNNHGGGFAGVSVVPWAESDSSMKAFDDNVFHVSCNERTCESDYNDSFEGDVNPASKRCSKKFTIPSFLKDGTYTIQWRYWGTGNNVAGSSLFKLEATYLQCIDIKVEGGAPYAPKATNSCPVFQGGELRHPFLAEKKACMYVGTGKYEYCPDGNCRNEPRKFGVPPQFAQCLGASDDLKDETILSTINQIKMSWKGIRSNSSNPIPDSDSTGVVSNGTFPVVPSAPSSGNGASPVAPSIPSTGNGASPVNPSTPTGNGASPLIPSIPTGDGITSKDTNDTKDSTPPSISKPTAPIKNETPRNPGANQPAPSQNDTPITRPGTIRVPDQIKAPQPAPDSANPASPSPSSPGTASSADDTDDTDVPSGSGASPLPIKPSSGTPSNPPFSPPVTQAGPPLPRRRKCKPRRHLS